jgi:hypothetical protein
MNNNLRITIIGLLLSCIISLIFGILYKHDNEKVIYMGNISDYELAGENYFFIVHHSVITENKLYIHGALLKRGTNLDYVNNRYVLIDKDNKLYGIKSIMINRPDVTEFFNDGYNYNNSGLDGQTRAYKINNGEYTVGAIIIERDGKKYLVISDNKITNEEHKL